MTTILRFILFFLLAPAFAIVAQAAGAAQDGFRVVRSGLGRLGSVAQGNHVASYTYQPQSSLLDTLAHSFNGGDVLTAGYVYDNLNRLTESASRCCACGRK